MKFKEKRCFSLSTFTQTYNLLNRSIFSQLSLSKIKDEYDGVAQE